MLQLWSRLGGRTMRWRFCWSVCHSVVVVCCAKLLAVVCCAKLMAVVCCAKLMVVRRSGEEGSCSCC